MALTNIKNWIGNYYDKLLAFASVLLLLGSLIYLAYSAGTLKSAQVQFQQEQRRLRPRHLKAGPPDLSLFEESIYNRAVPYQFDAWTNRLMIPEKRVSCVNCDRPIQFDASTCPYCRVEQPENTAAPSADRDGDGLPNAWEIQYGLNPLDPSDAGVDFDNDGFTNLEEYRFQPSTEPNNAKSHPSLIGKVYVETIEELPFGLVFKGVSKNSNNELVFQLNLRRNERTFFKKMNEEADGFKLKGYDPAFLDGGKKFQVLTLQRGDKSIKLLKGQVQPWQEFKVKLAFDPDKSFFDVRLDSMINIRGEKYKVKQIDSPSRRVLISDVSSGKDVWVGQKAAGEKPVDPARVAP